LTLVSLSAQVNLLRLDLVGDIDEQHVEEVAACEFRLEHNLDLVSLICSDLSSLRNQQDGYLFLAIINTINLRKQLELSCKGRF